MWEAIAEILTNSNALLVLIFAMIFASILIVLAATGNSLRVVAPIGYTMNKFIIECTKTID